MSTLQSPSINPLCSIGGELYECKPNFANSRKYWRQNPLERYPVVEITDDESREKAVENNVARNLIKACCWLGTTEADGTWKPIQVPVVDRFLDWHSLEDRMMGPEYTPLLAVMDESWRLAEEATKKAQAASPKTQEPTPIAA